MIMLRHPVFHFLYRENKSHNVYSNAVFAATFSLLSLPIVCLCGWYCANVVDARPLLKPLKLVAPIFVCMYASYTSRLKNHVANRDR